ncbi:histidine--tRNA ligase [Clostridia bacterium]|nr:histidine--tRNA ligase [Clostridia bacterium]
MFVKETVKGMRDVLPREMEVRDTLLTEMKRIYRSYGYNLIETPVMERIENMTNNSGGENEKLIFKVLKRGEKLAESDTGDPDSLVDSALRYDLTVPLARYFAGNAGKLPLPFKSLQIGSVFRADRPQKGRFRQFTQCDIDILGDKSPSAEIELILATSDFLDSAGISGRTVVISDRRILRAMAEKCGFDEADFSTVFIILDKFDKIGADGVKLELTDSGFPSASVESYIKLLGETAAASDKLSFLESELAGTIAADAIANLRYIIDSASDISGGNVNIRFDPTLVRGMSYYTGTIFEIVSDDFKGSSIAGGGRYDNMIGSFTGTPTPACGFSIGFERIIASIMEKANTSPSDTDKRCVLFSSKLVSDDILSLQKKCRVLRADGKTILVLQMNKNVDFQIKNLIAEGFQVITKVNGKEDILKL